MKDARLPWIALLALAGMGLAQQQQDPSKQPGPEPHSEEGKPEQEKKELIDLSPIAPDPVAEQAGDAQAEIIRLFHEVEKTLQSIDVELADAGAGQAPLGEGQESGIDKLLKSTGEKGEQAVAGIDKILELAQQLSGQSGGT